MGITFHDKPIPEPYTIYVQNFDFERYLEYAHEDINCELLDGVLIIHSPASLEHELIFKFILTLLDLHVQENNLGISLGSRFTMKLSSKWAPEPDIMFIAEESKDNLKDTYLDGPASVIFEILSPSTREDDLGKKLPKYLESGVKEVWIIDPNQRKTSIFWNKNDSMDYKGEEWAISRIIKDFRIKIDWLWQTGAISVLEKLKEMNK